MWFPIFHEIPAKLRPPCFLEMNFGVTVKNEGILEVNVSYFSIELIMIGIKFGINIFSMFSWIWRLITFKKTKGY